MQKQKSAKVRSDESSHLSAASNSIQITTLLPNSATMFQLRLSKNVNIQFSRTPMPYTTPAAKTTAAKTTAAAAATIPTKISSSHSTTLNTITPAATATSTSLRQQLLLYAIFLLLSIDILAPLKPVQANDFYASTTPINGILNATTAPRHAADSDFWKIGALAYKSLNGSGNNQTISPAAAASAAAILPEATASLRQPKLIKAAIPSSPSSTATFFTRFAKRLSTGNELWDGIIADCYQHPTFSCFQKNVYIYLNDALEANDVNVTQRLKFLRNHVEYAGPTTEAAISQDAESIENEEEDAEAHILKNEIPNLGRAAGETPIEEVTNALYGKSVKFAMTHDLEMQLPDMLFDGATFRISPRSMEGNGVIAKLELIPKQEVEARLAGKILMKKIQKFLKSKLLLSFLALVLIIKIIKIKLFWLLPIVIGVGAAKKLLLKFLLFLFPALSHLFKLCSYYQQTYHSTKYHHHHHLINHHHTVVPAWHSSEHHSVPELIYTNPPKGHPSAYLHGAPIHETYGSPSAHEHFDGGWEQSGPGLGTEYISDINRVAHIDENSNYFKPHTNDANELSTWGLGTTQANLQQQQQQQRVPATQQQRPPPTLKQQQQPQQQQYASTHSFNPFINPVKQSIFGNNLKQQQPQHSMPSPVYTPPRNAVKPSGTQINAALSAAQIAAQYDPTRSNSQKQQQQSPEMNAQLQEAIRIQAEQRIIAQQQKILENQPFVQDGQPIMPKNYDPFYSPILLKIDKILEQLGVKDELCKERLVCSMYKDPNRYSPHSNFVSAELSRDTNELQTVTNTNPAVVRFYRLIQAARDGQDQRDCLLLYPQCNINTE